MSSTLALATVSMENTFTQGGTYYVGEQKLTLEAARGVKALLDAGQGLDVVAEIVRVSAEGRAPKQAPGVFALALCCR